jgi:hypothetical protein
MTMLFAKREGKILQRGTVTINHGAVVAHGFRYEGYPTARHARLEVLKIELDYRALDPNTSPDDLALLHREFIELRDSL